MNASPELRPEPRWTAVTVGALLISTLMTSVAAGDLQVPWRPYLALVALCAVPGVAVWSNGGITDPALWLTMVLGTSVAVSSAIALALVWSGHWEPRRAAAIVCAASTVALVARLWGSRATSARTTIHSSTIHASTAGGKDNR